MNSDVYYLPELFIDIGRSAGLATAGDRWGADFTAATSAALSFAGPATVGLPNSIPLVLLGLFVLSITAPGCRRPFQSGLFSSR
jgi:hypothetical protein